MTTHRPLPDGIAENGITSHGWRRTDGPFAGSFAMASIHGRGFLDAAFSLEHASLSRGLKYLDLLVNKNAADPTSGRCWKCTAKASQWTRKPVEIRGYDTVYLPICEKHAKEEPCPSDPE